MSFCTAALTGAAVSYYAHGVVQEYYNPTLAKNRPKFLRQEYGYALFIGWASLVVGVLASVLISSSSIAMLVKPLPQPHKTHVHELRPVTIVPNVTTLEPVHVHQPAQSSGRQVRIQQTPAHSNVLTRNGTGHSRTNSGSSASKSGGSSQTAKNPRNNHHNHHHHHHGTVPRERSNEPSSARSRRRRSYDEGNSRRSRPVRGQVKQYV